MRRYLLIVPLAAIALTACGASTSSTASKPTTSTSERTVITAPQSKPTTTKPPTTTTTTAASSETGLGDVKDRYGDCITTAGDSLDSGKNVVLTGGGVGVEFTGHATLTFKVTSLNNKLYTVPADTATTNSLSAAGC